MPEICCLRPDSTFGKPEFTSSACGTFTKITETIKKLESWSKAKRIYDESIIMKPFDVETYIN